MRRRAEESMPDAGGTTVRAGIAGGSQSADALGVYGFAHFAAGRRVCSTRAAALEVGAWRVAPPRADTGGLEHARTHARRGPEPTTPPAVRGSFESLAPGRRLRRQRSLASNAWTRRSPSPRS